MNTDRNRLQSAMKHRALEPFERPPCLRANRQLRGPAANWLTIVTLAMGMLACVIVRGADLDAVEERTMQAAVGDIAESVVRIETIGGQERVGRMLVGTGPTTGLIVSSDGLIISSAFNFVQKPSSILVTLPDGRRRPATIVSRDHSCMLVLLKVNVDAPLAPPPAVPVEEMRVGQWAIAVGRTFEGDAPSQSVGILSALNRIWGKAIQTDANVSPSNYGGPLIDLRGRVLGVLVPLSPDSQSEVAGAQWYDSGIGFAVPLADVYQRLDRMREEDLYRGLMGITLKGKDVYSAGAIVAACRVKSPADEAGLRAGDEIVECNGQPIRRQVQLKHALGPLYAGEMARILVRRGEQQLPFEIELTDKLIPYSAPFLGILPSRSDDQGIGVPVRYVFSGSGAEAAGLEQGDRVTSLDGAPIEDTNALRTAIANLEPQQSVSVTVTRGEEELQRTVVLTTLPEQVPTSLPSAYLEDGEPAGDQPEVAFGETKVSIPEETSECFAYIPENYVATRAYGVVIHLTVPGELRRADLLERWKPLCDDSDLILLVPQPADSKRWQPTEVEFVRKCLEFITDRYQVDSHRVVVQGRQSGGSMAYLAAFRLRDSIRGLIATDAAIPRFLRPPDSEPMNRLAFYVARSQKSPVAARIDQAVEVLRQMKHPVVLKSLGELPREFAEEELLELVRWIDTLDRI